MYSEIPEGRWKMQLNGNSPRRSGMFKLLALMLSFAFCASFAVAQSTIGTGSITGTVTDQTGAVVSGARVTITNSATGQRMELTTSTSGTFNSGALPPGNYKVDVGAKGFSTASTTANVLVGNTATVNAKLQLGQESQTIEVQGTAVAVNTEQNQVQGVLNSVQIENLPVNGRNFLDLAQLEPGVQIQDGQNFDPTKAGYSSISFGGRFGRTARIQVDGVDVSDETVGTTTADIPASAIDEFQLSQSSLDLSQDLTSSGAVNVTTKSGTNSFHGEAFEYIRDHTFNANAPGGVDTPFQRHQFGGRLGGPIVKNKLFFFLDGERTKQDALASVDYTGTPYSSFTGGFTQPFRESNLLGRMDYNFANGSKAFYRYSYFSNSLFATFGLGYSVYDNKDVTRTHVFGYDFNTGNFNHSIRFEYLKFQNQIVDSTKGNNALPLCCTGLELSSGTFFVGPNLLAPQSTPQSDHQIKYDGARTFSRHVLRYGISFNHLQGGGFANFYGSAPRVSWSTNTTTETFADNSCGTGTPCFPGGRNNPLNYPVQRLRVGNGQGFNTLDPALGFPAGGLGPDNRLGIYIGDSWKIKPNFTVNVGLRYDRDTGRTDSDLPSPDCAGVDQTTSPCVALNTAFPGWGTPVKQANANFAPQLGFAWDPRNNGKTVIRGGAGLFYENVIWNNVLFDRPFRLKTGAFNQVTSACLAGQPQPVAVSGGFISPPSSLCGNVAVGTEIPQILQFWDQVLAGNPLDLKAPNPNYIGGFLGAGLGVPLGPFAPGYKTPRSVQFNLGIQHEIRHGMVFTADFVRNVETRTLLGVDVNHVGDVKNFDPAAAAAAINATNSTFGCGAGIAGVDCAITAGATIQDYAGNGLTADSDFGQACIQAIGVKCAFSGNNPNQAQAFFLQPIGRSVYNGLQMKLTQQFTSPMRGVKGLNLQIAYSLSRFENTGGAQFTGTSGDSDQDFVLQTADNNNPGRYFGPALLDRTHQISFGGFADVPGGFRLSLIGHFYSPLSSAIVSPVSGGLGEIFLSDFTGDGSTGDPLPGTHLGQFDRGTSASQLNNLLNAYNSKYGNQATPAGQAVISAGLMNLGQLQALGATSPMYVTDPSTQCFSPGQPMNCYNLAPQGQVDFTWLRAMDLKLAWRHTFMERLTIEPSVGFYNVPNFSNFNLPPNTMNGILNGTGSGSINGTSKSDNNQFRVGNGTGVYSLGSYRQIEWGLRFTF